MFIITSSNLNRMEWKDYSRREGEHTNSFGLRNAFQEEKPMCSSGTLKAVDVMKYVVTDLLYGYHITLKYSILLHTITVG